MRNLKFTSFIMSIFALLLTVVICSSCKHDEEIVPDYVGKWITAKTIPGASGYVLVNYTLTLTNKTFTETFLNGVGQYPKEANFVALEGSVSVAGNMMKLIVHKLSYSSYNSSTSTASDPYKTHTFTDDDFGFISEGIGTSTSNHQSEYMILDNQLTLKIDYDIDGDYSEWYENLVYTRQ